MTDMRPDDMVLMLNAGWSLMEIAAHFGMDVREVEQAIIKQSREDRTYYLAAGTIKTTR